MPFLATRAVLLRKPHVEVHGTVFSLEATLCYPFAGGLTETTRKATGMPVPAIFRLTHLVASSLLIHGIGWESAHSYANSATLADFIFRA